MDKIALQARLAELTNDWTGLQAIIAQRRQEIQQLHEQLAQKSADIERQNGAVAYNQILAERVKKQLAEADAQNA